MFCFQIGRQCVSNGMMVASYTLLMLSPILMGCVVNVKYCNTTYPRHLDSIDGLAAALSHS